MIANEGPPSPVIVHGTPDDAPRRSLGSLERVELKRIFASLPPAKLDETIGEFNAELLDQGDPVGGALTRLVFRAHGPWLGKAFRPNEGPGGEGYNIFGSSDDPNRKLQMDTYIGESSIVDGQSMILDYSMRNRGPLRWLLGELRRVDHQTILGMGVFGPRSRKYDHFKRIIPFVLSGPVNDFQASGDWSTSRESCGRSVA